MSALIPSITDGIYAALDRDHSASGDWLSDLRAAGLDMDAIDLGKAIAATVRIPEALSDCFHLNYSVSTAEEVAGEILDEKWDDELDALGLPPGKRDELQLAEVVSAVEHTFATIVDDAALALSVLDLSQYPVVYAVVAFIHHGDYRKVHIGRGVTLETAARDVSEKSTYMSGLFQENDALYAARQHHRDDLMEALKKGRRYRGYGWVTFASTREDLDESDFSEFELYGR